MSRVLHLSTKAPLIACWCCAAALLAACGHSSSTSVTAPSTDTERCSVSVQASATTMPAGGGNGSLTIDTARECQWTAAADAQWLTVATASGQGPATVAFTAGANRSIASRRGGIAVNGRRVEIAQDAATCNFEIVPRTMSVAAAGGTVRVTLTTDDFCPWTAVSREGWIALSPTSNRTGPAEIVLTIAANAGPSRTGVIEIAGQSVTVSQDAAPPGCSFSISPSNLTVPATGAETTVDITAPAECAWTAASNEPWITVSGSADGQGNGSVTLQIAANTGAPRTGRATVAGQTFLVSQAAAPSPSCVFTISQSNVTVDAAGATLTVTVSTTSNCSWTATPAVSWITVNGPASGSGNGSVALQVAANPGGPRTGVVTIAGQTLTITQVAASPPPACLVVVSPKVIPIDAGGGTADVSLTAEASCAWTASTSAAWISIAPQSGSGAATVRLTVAPNSGVPRSGDVSIAGQTVRIDQSAPCTYSIAPTSVATPAAGGTTTVTVTAVVGCTWTAVSNVAWVRVSSGATGSGNGPVSLVIDPNTGAARSGTVTIAGQTFTINQAAGCRYRIEPTSFDATAAGGATSVTVTTTAGCAWNTSGVPAWITVVGGSGTGNGIVAMTVLPNTGAARSAVLTIAGEPFTVSQAAAPCAFAVTPLAFDIDEKPQRLTIDIATASHCSWTASVTSGSSWLTLVSGQSGTGSGSTVVEADQNKGNARTGTLNVAGETVTIKQARK